MKTLKTHTTRTVNRDKNTIKIQFNIQVAHIVARVYVSAVGSLKNSRVGARSGNAGIIAGRLTGWHCLPAAGGWLKGRSWQIHSSCVSHAAGVRTTLASGAGGRGGAHGRTDGRASIVVEWFRNCADRSIDTTGLRC